MVAPIPTNTANTARPQWLTAHKLRGPDLDARLFSSVRVRWVAHRRIGSAETVVPGSHLNAREYRHVEADHLLSIGRPGVTEQGHRNFGAIDALCRMQLDARRLGCTIRVHDACPELRELIGLAGLADVLLGESIGQPEPTEQPGLEERVQRRNPPA